MSYAKVEAVNKILADGEPGNISVDEHSGYTGYKPQSVIDAMNAVFWGEWGFEELSSEVVASDKGGLAVAKVQVWIKGNEAKPSSYGQNRVTRGDVGDARKGAQTDAIKKALSYFSVGNRAYLGLLEKPEKEESSRPSAKPHVKPLQSQVAKQQAESVPSEKKKQYAPPTWEVINDYAVNKLKMTTAKLKEAVYNPERDGDMPDDVLRSRCHKEILKRLQALPQAS